MKQEIIICVPGPWENKSQIIEAIVNKSGGYIFAGFIIMKIADSKVHGQLECLEKDPSLARSFQIAGQGKLSQETLKKIENHKCVVYLKTEHVGYPAIQNTMDIVCGLLNAGGIAVKVETAGVAHEAGIWRQYTGSDDLFSKYSAFIVFINGGKEFYSCGMQNFGLPDCAVNSKMDPGDAAYLMNVFNMYRIVENPKLKDKETFSIDEKSAHYRLKWTEYTGYKKDNTLYNQYGKWVLKE